MSYVFDNGPFSNLFRNFYPTVFTTLWQSFDQLITADEIVSCREVSRELADFAHEGLRTWVTANSRVFHVPTPEEAAFIGDIYRIAHFRQNIEQQKLLKGGKVADPFVIAKARIEGRTVVTREAFRPNAAKIPNICQHFGVRCVSLQEFMEEQGWRF